MLERANHLAAHPEFYNTLTNTCTTNLVSHVNDITPRRVPLSFDVLLPANADRLAYKLGLIDTSAPLEEVRKRAKINDLAEKYADDPAFSRRIRGLHKIPSIGVICSIPGPPTPADGGKTLLGNDAGTAPVAHRPRSAALPPCNR